MNETITVLMHCYLPRTDRACPVNVTYNPSLVEEPAPVILFFHGKGGTRDHYQGLANDWAECGYITLRPDMRDSPNVLDNAANNDATERYWDAQDIAAVMPELLLPLRLQMKNFVVAGHSFGGRNVLAAFGLRTKGAADEDFTIPEAMTGLVLSPLVEDGTLADEPYRDINAPTFHVTGTEDGKDLGDPGPDDEDVDYTARCKAFEGVPGPALLSVYRDGDHGHGWPFGALGRTCAPQIAMCLAQFRTWLAWSFTRDRDAEEALTAGDWPGAPTELAHYEHRNWPPSHG